MDPLTDFDNVTVQGNNSNPRKKYRADFASMEFHFPEESRDFNITLTCPICRARDCKLVYECQTGPEDPWSKTPIFYIRCKDSSCRYEGPRFNNSQHAVQNWRLHAALTE